MHIQKEVNPALNTVTAYGDDYIEINKTRHTQSVYFTPEGQIHDLGIQSPTDFTTELLQKITGLVPIKADAMAFLDNAPPSFDNPEQIEVVLIGTGAHQHFLPPQLTNLLLMARIGVEVMDSQAAARTYNILMSEGRRVVAALII
ncbi:MAG TPA: Mth938-like domain-containing protein [Paenalcaligenes hominis]|uniref:Mth938-like domain-containing protein n=1 Tax=Paenalcaligenes hominis TaxID=643674 RepID=A0A9D2VGU8_9BURK|nr:Mth938-like domain-containing protein [Paenalcaligenes hominis]